MFFFFKQKTAYEMRISDWSSDVCSSDLANEADLGRAVGCDIFGNVTLGEALRFQNQRHVLRPLAQFHDIARLHPRGGDIGQIGSASCRERVCQYVYISVVAVSLKKKLKQQQKHD